MSSVSGTQSPVSYVSARNAIYAAFFANGLIVGHWAPKIPFMVDRLNISEAILGQMIILFGIGALVALIAGAWCVTQFGSRAVLRWTSLMMVPSLIMLTIMPDAFSTAVALLWLGMFLGAMDNAMNANGVGVEINLGRPVMSSYHGFWSLGGVIGGLSGGAMIVWFGEMGHAVLVTLMLLALVAWAWPRYLDYDDNINNDDTEEGELQVLKKGLPRQPAIYLLGIMTLLAFAPESVVIDWSALYLSDELDAPLLVSGYAVAAFSAAMALMRFRGDQLRARFGDRTTFIFSGLMAGLGLLIVGFANGVFVACVGFLVSGIGMANMVPVLFSTAGRFPGINPAVAIAVITAFGYGGLIFIPALMGWAAENYSIALVYGCWGAIVLAMGLSGFVLPHLRGRPKPNV